MELTKNKTESGHFVKTRSSKTSTTKQFLVPEKIMEQKQKMYRDLSDM